MKIGVIGAGKLGICVALLLERAGHHVIASDIRDEYVQKLNKKEISSKEPEVSDLLFYSKNFTATIDNKKLVQECDVMFTYVATPSLENGDYDVSSIQNVVNEILACPRPERPKCFIIGCTTNPGDCENFAKQLRPHNIETYYNPEFIAQGSIIRDLKTADMVLIGCENRPSVYLDTIKNLYRQIQTSIPKFNEMPLTAAEITKLAVNCFLTTKISYANTIGEIAVMAGIPNEASRILKAVGEDSRVGQKFLSFGFGFGGPCLPRDNRSLAAYAKKLGIEHNLGMTTDNINNEHAKFLTKWLIQRNTQNLPFAMHYISYKQGTDMVIESQQYRLCKDLLHHGYKVYVMEYELLDKDFREDLEKMYPGQIVFGIPNEQVYWIDI